jgi:putative SOS response-associated peptidase YedK
MAFVGLWEYWCGEDDEIVCSFAVITTDAIVPMQAVHDRMPVILAPGDWAAWLEDGRGPSAALAGVQGGGLAAEQFPFTIHSSGD